MKIIMAITNPLHLLVEKGIRKQKNIRDANGFESGKTMNIFHSISNFGILCSLSSLRGTEEGKDNLQSKKSAAKSKP